MAILSSLLLLFPTVLPTAQDAPSETWVPEDFHSRFDETLNGHFIGEAYWGNRLQDWRIRDGWVECTAKAPRLSMRTLHLLSHTIEDNPGGFEMRVHLEALPTPNPLNESSAAGFLVGVGGGEMDWRAASIVQGWAGNGGGIFAAVSSDGRCYILDHTRADAVPIRQVGDSSRDLPSGGVILELEATEVGQEINLRVRTLDPETGTELHSAVGTYPPNRVLGNVALVSHPGAKEEGRSHGRFRFREWQLSGTRVTPHEGRSFGPVASSQYTLSRNTLKLTAQFLPLAQRDPVARFEVRDGASWREVARAPVLAPSYTAQFRVVDWDDTRAHATRVALDLQHVDGSTSPHTWDVTIRKDPRDKQQIHVAGFTGNHNNSHNIGGGWGGAPGADKNDWVGGMWFSHADLTANVAKVRPDLLFFSGDQIYEGKSPTFADRQNIELDYLYKWLMWCWAWRDLTKSIPAVTMPDDHDVYQGNVWGEGGRKAPRDVAGGYVHSADFVRMVEATQTSHLPDSPDPAPVDQGIGVYFTDLVWGRISFAVLEDRKFKSGCKRDDMPPTGTNRFDHVLDDAVDVAGLDIEGLTLLGPRQLAFLDEWARDWRGADMKAALSQTTFAGLATHHGAGMTRLRADLDSNGWPQTGRRLAVDALRKAFAFHLCGDQHLATFVHHGIDQHRDANWSFCVPSVANFYPRKWDPLAEGANRSPNAPTWTGDHLDGFGHPVSIFAATNPGEPSGHEPADLHDKMAGFGLIVFDKEKRTIRAECWPRYADPWEDEQYAGWPRTISQTSNYGRTPVAWLPQLVFVDAQDPIVRVLTPSNELVYAIRAKGSEFQPWTFAPGMYRIELSRDGETWLDYGPLEARAKEETVPVEISL